jgi:hypothetical protein
VALGESNQDRPDNSREHRGGIVLHDPLLSNETGARVIRFTPREGGLRVNRGAERFVGNADPDPSPVPDLGSAKASSVPRKTQTAVLVSSGAANPIVPVLKCWVLSFSPALAALTLRSASYNRTC